MNKAIGDIMRMVNDASGKNEMKQILIENQPPYLIEFVRMAFDETIPWSFKKGGVELPYLNLGETPDGMGMSSLNMELGRMYLFQEGKDLPDKKRQELLIQIVESLPLYEAELVVALVTGERLPVKGLTKNFMKELNESFVVEAVES